MRTRLHVAVAGFLAASVFLVAEPVAADAWCGPIHTGSVPEWVAWVEQASSGARDTALRVVGDTTSAADDGLCFEPPNAPDFEECREFVKDVIGYVAMPEGPTE